jgi:hypothetical protein
MNLLQNTAEKKKLSQSEEIRPFRAEVRTTVVGNTTLKTTDVTGLGPDGVKVSEYRLEQYLNACSPTCHG